jgi:hypothetical protein
MKDQLRAWWTSGGWERAPAPAQFQAADMEVGDFDRALEAADYHLMVQLGGSLELYELKVWRSRTDQHCYVDLWDVEGEWSSFFVSSGHADAFIIDKLPMIMQALAAVQISDELRKIRRTLVAYVRHGQGTDTIDEYGEDTEDDTRRRRREWYRRQEAKAAGKSV